MRQSTRLARPTPAPVGSVAERHRPVEPESVPPPDGARTAGSGAGGEGGDPRDMSQELCGV